MNSTLFRTSSTTYFYSSLFFPQQVRNEVTTLYVFVRTADNFVDILPADKKGFMKLKQDYLKARNGEKTGVDYIDDFCTLEKEKGFNPQWTEDFLASMEMDLSKTTYANLKETEQYIYGSANVIGLYMTKILNLPAESYPYAELMGKSMQFINFIRDIDEDVKLGRNYFPQEDMKQFGLKTLEEKETRQKPDRFIAFIHYQLDRYNSWQAEAEKGFSFIPRRFRIPIKTASDLYKWTGGVIRKNPFVVYERKVKPQKGRVLLMVLKNIFTN
jgi:15-cis-phytoene synthase